MDNSFEKMRKTFGLKKPKSLDDFDGEEEERNIKDIILDKKLST